jgi:hypothetical protein
MKVFAGMKAIASPCSRLVQDKFGPRKFFFFVCVEKNYLFVRDICVVVCVSRACIENRVACDSELFFCICFDKCTCASTRNSGVWVFCSLTYL